jgi:hypothetical protein
MRHEISDCHFTRHNERGRTGEQADKQQQAANDLNEPGKSEQRKQLQVIKARHMRETNTLGQPVLKKEKRRDDPQDAERAVRPAGVDLKHLGFSFFTFVFRSSVSPEV